MNTTKNSKLIAEFMEWEEESWSYNSAIAYFTPFSENSLFAEDLKFHSSWDWLMPVVEKIFNTCEVTPDDLDCQWNIFFKEIHLAFYCPKIENVYNACVTFIEWYNKQK